MKKVEQFYQQCVDKVSQLQQEGLYKQERVIVSPQKAHITLQSGQAVLNLCANNYLGLANHPLIEQKAKEALDTWGFGLASVRFICGTQQLHLELEAKIASFLQQESSILYSSCFDANGGLFETLLTEEDAIISDALNHASIIDGIRLCKAQRYRYQHNDMQDLEKQLQAAQSARFRMIATDGVFSMDGTIASLQRICELAESYDALVMVDDCHATGFLGEHGRGSAEYCRVLHKVDFITGTLGKALGGASGGFIAGKKASIDLLRQRSRPYLFSNTLTPCLAAAGLEALRIVEEEGAQLRKQLFDNSCYFRQQLQQHGFTLAGADHPIIPIMIFDAQKAAAFAQKMLEKGIYVISFSYPVVPMNKARIRTQMSAVHTKKDLDYAVTELVSIGRELGVI